MAFGILSLLTVSCAKPNDVPSAPAANPRIVWKPTGFTTPMSIFADRVNGEMDILYTIYPNLNHELADCNGTWSLSVDPPPHAVFSAGFSAAKDYVTFMPLSPGTYKITIKYSCSCIFVSETITFVIG